MTRWLRWADAWSAHAHLLMTPFMTYVNTMTSHTRSIRNTSPCNKKEIAHVTFNTANCKLNYHLFGTQVN